MSETFQGEVCSLSSEGFGILRQNNFVVFVPYTAPGDIIRYSIEHQKKNYAIGKLVEVLEPSPSRTTPLCRYYGRCGGCQLQHMQYEAQVESKQQIVLDAFKRIGKFQDVPIQPVEPAEKYWAYRRHITLKIHPEGSYLAAGYVSIDNASIIDVEHCPIFIDEKDAAIQDLQFLLKNFSSYNFSNGTATLFKTENKKMILNLRFENELKFESRMIENFLKQYPGWLGIILHEGKVKRTWGTTKDVLKIDHMLFTCSPDVFTQIHPQQSLKIYHQIVGIAEQRPAGKVWDLYCGIGISSLLMAKQGHAVTGVEYNHDAIQFAKENAAVNGISTALFIQGDVEQVLRQKLKNERADMIIVNPPRIGLTPKVIEEILRRRPQEIIYVSCMPSTLARDLGMLCAKDYKLALVKPYDMFPQTCHIETLAHLVLK